jgi:hypothetical protein
VPWNGSGQEIVEIQTKSASCRRTRGPLTPTKDKSLIWGHGCQSVSQWSLGSMALGHDEAEQDGGRRRWLSRAAHIMGTSRRVEDNIYPCRPHPPMTSLPPSRSLLLQTPPSPNSPLNYASINLPNRGHAPNDLTSPSRSLLLQTPPSPNSP